MFHYFGGTLKIYVYLLNYLVEMICKYVYVSRVCRCVTAR